MRSFFPSAFRTALCLAVSLLAVFVTDTWASSPAQTKAPTATGFSYRPRDPLSDSAFERFYNMDYDHAVDDFQRVVDKFPEDPFAVNHLLAAVLFRELYRMGALSTGEFANDSFISAPHHKADPAAKVQIKQLVDRALRIEQKRLDASPKDVDTLYARGITRAQFSTYTALIEHAWFSALRNAVGARHDHEHVLELSPGYTDAKLVVGAHNYVVGSLPWAVKVSASLIGLSGNKEKGIQYLYETARAGGETAFDAKVILVLFLRRERRFAEALQIVQPLVAAYPQNSLLAMEEGNLLRASEKFPEAAAVYRRIWQDGRQGHYPNQHYELAAIALGDLMRSRKDYQDAAAAYELVEQVPQPDPELKQRATLGAGEMYDLMMKRDLAVKKYQEVIALNSETDRAEIARKRMKEAYRE